MGSSVLDLSRPIFSDIIVIFESLNNRQNYQSCAPHTQTCPFKHIFALQSEGLEVVDKPERQMV